MSRFLDETGLAQVAGVVNKKASIFYGTQAEWDELTTDEKKKYDYAVFGDGSSSSITAANVPYDNTESGLTADNVQDAIDEVVESAAVDQTYNSASTNAQSGKAVAQAIDSLKLKVIYAVSGAPAFDPSEYPAVIVELITANCSLSDYTYLGTIAARGGSLCGCINIINREDGEKISGIATLGSYLYKVSGTLSALTVTEVS